MIWAIGTPSAAVRIYVESHSQERVELQRGDGEVAVQVAARQTFAGISDDGASIIEGPPPTDWEINRIRAQRTALLSASDWTQVTDAPLSDELRAAWRSYRQALRDLSETQPNATVETVVWPVAPNAGA